VAAGVAVLVPTAVVALAAVVVLAAVPGVVLAVAVGAAVDVVPVLVVEVPEDDVAGVDDRQALATLAVLIAVPECEG
jgi:hypothetical protein